MPGQDSVLATELFGMLFEHCTEAVFAVDRSSERIVTANGRLEDLTGRSRDSLIGTTLSNLLAEGDAEGWRHLTDRPGLHEDVPVARLDGYPVYVALTVAHVEHRVGSLATCIARDTTERKLLERELI